MEIRTIDEGYLEYLKDESRSVGMAETISFPFSEEEVVDTVRRMADTGTPITIQGARTGVAAAAVPYGGHVLNLSRMNNVLGLQYDSSRDTYLLRVQPGLLLSQLNKMIAQCTFLTRGWDDASISSLRDMRYNTWFFPPDPTEQSASIGGMAACNASGAKTFTYGPTRDYIEGLRMVLADGDILDIRRGNILADERTIRFSTLTGRKYEVKLPDYNTRNVKSAAGYYVHPGMDLIDLIVGAEGTLGVITELTVRLIRLPLSACGITMFMPTLQSALDIVCALRGEPIHTLPLFPHRPAAIEFFDSHSLDLLRDEQQHNMAFSQIQPIASHCNTALYAEFHAGSKEELWMVLSTLGGLLTELGGNEADTWIADNERDMEKLRFFRHACPECVNLIIDERRKADSRITKLGTDMSVPDNRLRDVMSMYTNDLERIGLQHVIFGHIGQNHLHVNILPRSMEEYDTAKALYKRWATQISGMGGSVAAEHGIGKLKVPFLREMYDDAEFEQMRALKRAFDPEELLNKENILGIEA